MIGNQKLAKDLAERLQAENVGCELSDLSSPRSIDLLYNSALEAAVVDVTHKLLPEKAWHDILTLVSKRVPVLVIHPSESAIDKTPRSELLIPLLKPTAQAIMDQLAVFGFVASSDKKIAVSPVPLFNTQVALELLKSRGSLSVITVNATGFRKVAMDHGFEAYQQLQECFHKILSRMWGTPGAFRRTDMLIRRSVHSNTYYIFLEQSRQAQSVPAPGVLEAMADRIALKIQRELWDEIFKSSKERSLPDCITTAPAVSAGYATSLYNPCADAHELVEHLLDTAMEVAKVQLRRIKDRALELMHTVIQTKNLLYPHYQGIFRLGGLTKELVEEVKAKNSIQPLLPMVYGFESLIRVRSNLVQMAVGGDALVHIDARMLRPDILFSLAHLYKIALELDQVCLNYGVTGSIKLPGKLMVNILPRNLLHIERLLHLIDARKDITFELSESENISNPSLMGRVRRYISDMGCSIAADDFGKGYTNIERVLSMKPEVIKLDRSLITGLDKDPSKQSFVKGIVQAAKLANSMILAEGVETWEEASAVQSMGIDLIQGFLCHKPQALEQIIPQLVQEAEDDNRPIPLNSVA